MLPNNVIPASPYSPSISLKYQARNIIKRPVSNSMVILGDWCRCLNDRYTAGAIATKKIKCVYSWNSSKAGHKGIKATITGTNKQWIAQIPDKPIPTLSQNPGLALLDSFFKLW